MFGSSNPYARPGETQVTVSTRNLKSTDHYNGTAEQLQRQTLDTYVLNMQHAVDFNITHAFTERVSMSVGLPFVAASWGIPSPTSAGAGARANEDAHGLGDIAVGARAWVLNTQLHRSGNIAVGLGIKTPSGNSGYKDMYPDSAGRNNALRFVDQSVQPGDGGWGLLVDISGFRRIPHGQLFGSLSYLANPRDRNDTTSGSINVNGSAGTVHVHSVSGSVSLASSGRAAVKATTVSGSITIRLPPGTRPDVRSSGGGTLRNTFDPGDDVLVEVANVSGNVQLVSS